jgi:hypothetical protein
MSSDESRRRQTLRFCEQFRQGDYSTQEACAIFVFSCVEPTQVEAHVELLPNELRDAVREFVRTLPNDIEEWSRYQGILQLDGNDQTRAAMWSRCRDATEAVRRYFASLASETHVVD